MMTMPASSVSRIVDSCKGLPSQRISPSHVPCGYTPDSTFINVDLPAPFSPHKPTHSPGATVRSIPSSAFTPEKALTMPRIVNRGCVIRNASLQGARSITIRRDTLHACRDQSHTRYDYWLASWAWV